MSTEDSAAYFRLFAEGEVGELPVYRRLSLACAGNHDVLDLMESAPKGQRRPNLLFAAVHDLLLSGVDHDLAAWYPTVSGSPAPSVEEHDPAPAFFDFVERWRSPVLDALTKRATQTNEVNRSCLWWVASRAAAADVAGRPLAWLELGASGGLNLVWDRHRYDWAGTESDASVLRCEMRGDRVLLAAPAPMIGSRIGLDLDPIDLTDERAVRWLKACVWPEQIDRHRRFDTAVERVRSDPPTILAGDLVDRLDDAVDCLDHDAHLVVVTSWVLTYVRRDRRLELARRLAGHADGGRPVTWVTAEGPGVVESIAPAGGTSTTVGMTRWRGGHRTDATVARCHAHLAWLDWF